MPFQPKPKQRILINGRQFTFAEHPNAPGIVYGQEGRQATVYQLGIKGKNKAFKIFKARFRNPYLVGQAQKLKEYSNQLGLSTCSRSVLSPSKDRKLLSTYPDLIYAVVMPWIYGETWVENISSRRILTPQKALVIAKQLADVLFRMEVNNLAHCDLSGANLIITTKKKIELVDVEGFYAPDLSSPEVLPAGSPGYAHSSSPKGIWSPQADRFAAAILFAEILGSCDQEVVDAAWGESFFEPRELMRDSHRYNMLHQSLMRHWGKGILDLFFTAWRSNNLADCPTMGEWHVQLPSEVPLSTLKRTAQTGTAGKLAENGKEKLSEKSERKGRDLKKPKLELVRVARDRKNPVLVAVILATLVTAAIFWAIGSIKPLTQEPKSITGQAVDSVENESPTSNSILLSSDQATVDERRLAWISNEVPEVNLRRTPGYISKGDSQDVIVKIPSGAEVKIIDGPYDVDGLDWWRVSWEGYVGYVAEYTGAGRQILIFLP